jgi:hypothetical protein
MGDQSLSVKHVRQNCLECCVGSRPAVIWCTCHGEDGAQCQFWPFRFGVQPATFRAKYGDRLLTPSLMPPSSVELENLPGTLESAATGEIDMEGYRQPVVAVERKATRQMSPEQRQAAVERLRKARAKRSA